MGDDEEFECTFEEVSIRTKVTANVFLIQFREWDEKAIEAFKNLNEVEQKHLSSKQYIDKVNAVAIGAEPLDSILTLFIDDEDDEK